MSQQQIAFIGLGVMGIEMSKNLQRHVTAQGLPPLLYWNRTISKGESLKALGGQESSVEEIAAKADIIFTILNNDATVKDVFAKLLSSPAIKGKTIVEMTTISPDTADVLAAEAEAKQVEYISSPVFGVSHVAAAGKLLFIQAGDEKAVAKVEPFIIDVMGRKVSYLGPQHRKASTLKVVGNAWVLSHVVNVAEVTVLAETSGLSPDIMTEWASDLGGPFFATYFQKNSTGIYDPPEGQEPMFSGENAVKDASYGLALAAKGGAKMTILEKLKDSLARATEHKQGGTIDVSAAYGVARLDAGLDFENDAVKARNAKKTA